MYDKQNSTFNFFIIILIFTIFHYVSEMLQSVSTEMSNAIHSNLQYIEEERIFTAYIFGQPHFHLSFLINEL